MTEEMVCSVVGKWRIVEADLWDRDYLDLVGPAHITFHGDGHGEIALGALSAGLDCEYSPSIIFFTWEGFDEMDEARGDGSAELNDDGTLDIELRYHLGDEVELKARRG